MADQGIDDPNQDVRQRRLTGEFEKKRARREVNEATGNVWTYQSLSGMLLGVLTFVLLCYICVYHGNDVQTQRGLKAAQFTTTDHNVELIDSGRAAKITGDGDVFVVGVSEVSVEPPTLTFESTVWCGVEFKYEQTVRVGLVISVSVDAKGRVDQVATVNIGPEDGRTQFALVEKMSKLPEHSTVKISYTIGEESVCVTIQVNNHDPVNVDMAVYGFKRDRFVQESTRIYAKFEDQTDEFQKAIIKLVD